MQTGQAVQLLAGATDAGADDVLTCTVQWGDGDTGSGCDGTHTYTAPGAVTLRVTVADGDGGTDVRTVALTVTAPPSEPTAWPWEGFFQPVDNLPTVNVVKAGSAVPVKFSIGGFRGTDIFADGYPASSAASCSASADTDTLEEVERLRQPEILEYLPQERAIAILNDMAPDAAADLLELMPRSKSDRLIALLEPEVSNDIQLLLSYPNNSAAGLMTTDFVMALEDETVEEALAYQAGFRE